MVDPQEQARMNRLMSEQLEREPHKQGADREADRYERWLDRIGEDRTDVA